MDKNTELITTININKSTGIQELKTIIQKKVCYTSFIKHPYTNALCGITNDAQLHISIPGVNDKLVSLDDIFWKADIFNHTIRFTPSEINYEYIVHNMLFCTNGDTNILGISITSNLIVNGINMAHNSYDDLERGVSVLGIIRINTADPEMPINLNYIDYKLLLSCIICKIAVPFVWLSEDIIYIDKGIAALSPMSDVEPSCLVIENGYGNLPEPIKKILKPLLELDPLTATIVKSIALSIGQIKNFIGCDMYCPKDLNITVSYLYHVDENRVFCYKLNDVFERTSIKVKSDHAKYRIKGISYENKLMAVSPHGQLAIYTEAHSHKAWELSIYALQEETEPITSEQSVYLTQINYIHVPQSVEPIDNTPSPLKAIHYDADNTLWLLNTKGDLLQFNTEDSNPKLEVKQTNISWLTKCGDNILICQS
jgi:hypothetical protein